LALISVLGQYFAVLVSAFFFVSQSQPTTLPLASRVNVKVESSVHPDVGALVGAFVGTLVEVVVGAFVSVVGAFVSVVGAFVGELQL